MLKDLSTLETFNNSSKKFSFIHIPKTGGSSIQKLMENSNNKVRLHDHFSYTYKKSIDNDPNIKFTIVRNPYDRLVSAFHYLKKGGANNKTDLEFQKKLEKFHSFKDFINNFDNKLMYDIFHFVPQYEYIVFNNNLMIDNILHLENINNEFKNFCLKYNLGEIIFPNTNKSSHENYTIYIKDKNIRDKIYKLYEKDFNLLNYSY